MDGRDGTLIALGAAMGLGLGVGIGLLPAWDPTPGPASAPTRTEAAPPITVPGASPRVPGTADAPPASSRSVPTEEAATTEDRPTLYREDGGVPCDADCIDRLTGLVLSGSASGQDFDDAMMVSQAIGQRIGSDPALARRFLGALSGLRTDANASSDHALLLSVILQGGGLPDPLLDRASERLAASPQPLIRSLALQLATRSGTSPEAQRAVVAALTQETDPLVLSHALNVVSLVGADAQPGLMAQVRRMATDHAEPRVRQAALQAYAWREDVDADDVRRLMDRAMEDPAPLVRVGAISHAMSESRERLPERDLARYREALRGIANDADADPEARLQALSMMTYMLADENGQHWSGMYDRY